MKKHCTVRNITAVILQEMRQPSHTINDQIIHLKYGQGINIGQNTMKTLLLFFLIVCKVIMRGMIGFCLTLRWKHNLPIQSVSTDLWLTDWFWFGIGLERNINKKHAVCTLEPYHLSAVMTYARSTCHRELTHL